MQRVRESEQYPCPQDSGSKTWGLGWGELEKPDDDDDAKAKVTS